MRKNDATKLRRGMQNEWCDQVENTNFMIELKSSILEGATVLPAYGR